MIQPPYSGCVWHTVGVLALSISAELRCAHYFFAMLIISRWDVLCTADKREGDATHRLHGTFCIFGMRWTMLTASSPLPPDEI